MLTGNNLFLVDFFINLILGDRHHSCKHDIPLICRDEPIQTCSVTLMETINKLPIIS